MFGRGWQQIALLEVRATNTWSRVLTGKRWICSNSGCRFIWQVPFPGGLPHLILRHYLPFGTTIVGR